MAHSTFSILTDFTEPSFGKPTALLPAPSMVADINPGSASSSIASLVNVNNTLYFTANDGTHGTELWKVDPITGSASMLKDISTAAGASSNPANFTNVNGTLFFTATDGASPNHGIELWRSDGTPNGTVMVKDISTAAGASSSLGTLPTSTARSFSLLLTGPAPTTG